MTLLQLRREISHLNEVRYSVDSEPTAVSSMPEKVLLAAILEMSVRDLLFGNSYILKKESINWILYDWKKEKEIACFSFTDCVEHLDLSASQVKYLVDAAKEVEGACDKWKSDKHKGEVSSLPRCSTWRRVRYSGMPMK